MKLGTDPLVWNLSLALMFGTFSFFLSKKTKIAPIVFFIIIGILLGPNFLKILSPEELGKTLKSIVFLGVAIILFEGGLTLDYSGYKKAIKPIVYLLSLGVIVTWLLNAIFIYFLFDFDFSFALFASSLIIVTGPTVITPILRRINVNKKIFNILHWEGVLIDPIGVFLALLCFELLTNQGSGTSEAITGLVIRLGTGLTIGSLLGFIAISVIKKKWIPIEMLNAFTLSIAILTFALCDAIATESGLLGVVICGFFIGIKKSSITDDIKRFKLEITEILVGVLFILLAANLDLNNLNLFGVSGIFLLLTIVFITRPLSVFLCTVRSDLKTNEKLFISWISPRGIVVASMASLFYISLRENPDFIEQAWFVETFTFSVIIVTVLFQGLSAGLLSRLLKINKSDTKEWIIVGIHEVSIQLSNYLKKQNQEVILIDNNFQQVKTYLDKGYSCIHLNALSQEIFDDQRFFSSTHLVALTDNMELNALICQHWKVLIAKENLFRWGKIEKKKEKTLIGHIIWEDLEKPSQISNRIMEQDQEMISFKKIRKTENKILAYQQDEQIFLCENTSTQEKNIYQNGIVLKKKKHVTTELAPQDFVFYSGKTSIDEAIENIVNKAAKKLPKIPKQEISQRIWSKIKEEAIYLGNQFALITLKDHRIKKNYSSICLFKKGIDLRTYDGLKLKVIIFHFNALNNSLKHIKILMELSKIINSDEKKQKIFQAKNKQDLLKVFK